MSRSYRKPFGTFCSIKSSARHDKQLANRAVRRKQKSYIDNLEDFEEFLLPHRLECSHNDVWVWNRDGRQHLMMPSAYDYSRYCLKVNGLHPYGNWPGWKADNVWPPEWWWDIQRK